MSGFARKARRRRRRMDSQVVESANRIRGCTCRPNVRHWTDDAGLRRVTITHDERCAADCDPAPMVAVAPGHLQTVESFARDIAAVVEAMRE